MKDLNTKQRRATVGERQDELKPKVPKSLFVTTLWALVGACMVIVALWGFGIIQIIVN